ncbi:MAG: hypothetical protein DWQ08_07075 [Proteobacteria bacterium]|nr:MAG: hypothetical protein DWQ08_07075 [Pseudomonadota bacterium]
MTAARNKRQHRARREFGFTLVELMVSVIIGMLLAGALVAIVVNSTSAYNVQLDHARVYENARFALEFLSRDVRMAGYFGCLENNQNVNNNLNFSNGSLYDIDEPVEGFENDGNEAGWRPSGTSVSGLNVATGSDAITLRFANPTEAAKVEAPSTPDSPIDADENGYVFSTGEVVVVSDCDKADVVQLTDVDKSTNLLSHGMEGELSPGNAYDTLGGDLGDGYDTTGTVMTFNAVRYFVRKRDPGDTDANAAVALYRQHVGGSGVVITEELIDGVENMQVMYGVDTDSDGVPNSYVKANAVGAWRNVVSLQIALLLRSNEEYDSADGVAGAFPETLMGENLKTLLGDTEWENRNALRVRRHAFSTTIELRNPL